MGGRKSVARSFEWVAFDPIVTQKLEKPAVGNQSAVGMPQAHSVRQVGWVESPRF